jgi:hypothetical protein
MKRIAYIILTLPCLGFTPINSDWINDKIAAIVLADNIICLTMPDQGSRWLITNAVGTFPVDYGQSLCITNNETITLSEKHLSLIITASTDPSNPGIIVSATRDNRSFGDGVAHEKVFIEAESFDKSELISETHALAVAKGESLKVMDIPSDVIPLIHQTNCVFIVTFPIVLPEHSRGPDYYTKCIIHAKTGKLIQILGSQD